MNGVVVLSVNGSAILWESGKLSSLLTRGNKSDVKPRHEVFSLHCYKRCRATDFD